LEILRLLVDEAGLDLHQKDDAQRIATFSALSARPDRCVGILRYLVVEKGLDINAESVHHGRLGASLHAKCITAGW
jgi:hypothetical protein